MRRLGLLQEVPVGLAVRLRRASGMGSGDRRGGRPGAGREGAASPSIRTPVHRGGAGCCPRPRARGQRHPQERVGSASTGGCHGLRRFPAIQGRSGPGRARCRQILSLRPLFHGIRPGSGSGLLQTSPGGFRGRALRRPCVRSCHGTDQGESGGAFSQPTCSGRGSSCCR